jgi:DNA adenine methylase
MTREHKTGFRANANKQGTTPAHDWANMPDAMAAVGHRLSGVVIENRPALDVMQRHDGPETLHYVDPPYVPETRSGKGRSGGVRYHAYRHEMTVEDHRELATALRELVGMVILSGYPSGLYDELYAGWARIERESLADGARKRTEVLWCNEACADAKGHGPLFTGTAA